MRLAAILDAGLKDFLEATRDVSPEQASLKPTPGCWSVLECIEHVATVEERYLSWIENGTAIPPRRDSDKEMRLFSAIRSRLTKVEAPDVTRPRGRFVNLAEALAAFTAVRDRSRQMAKERGDALYSVGATHPFFGKVNGVEMMQLIDGHARRHADQIREICEARPAPRKARKPPAAIKKGFAFRRAEPDLPNHLEEMPDAGALFGDSENVEIHDVSVRELERNNTRVKTFRIEGSVLDRVQLSGGEFGSVVWKDIRLVGCDLANIRVHRISLLRVELIDCRLAGFSATALDCQDVLIQNGDLRYALFGSGHFRSCEFQGCNFGDADLRNADLTGSTFRSCDLMRADLQGSTLQNADFRGSQVEGMLVGMNDLRGAIVDPAQAMIFARVLGLQIA